MEISVVSIDPYLDGMVPARSAEMQSMEASARQTDYPIIGPAAGHFCYLVARMIQARRIFEMGSGNGYSTAWLARAVQENGGGEVFHVVWDESLSNMARSNLNALGFGEIIHYRVNEALQTLRESEGLFDLIFNDIEKHAYPESLEVIAARLRPGGVMIADNLLCHGLIFDARDRSPATQSMREFTRMVMASPDWAASIIPIRDGLLVAYRR